MMEGKTCTVCGEFKSLLEFNVRSMKKDGRRSECKECQRKADKERYERKKAEKEQLEVEG